MAERNGTDTREKILEVAEQAFARDGYAGAHLQAIAEQVGVRKTALYYYFQSKAALHEEVLVRMLEGLDHALDAAVGVPGDAEERLVRLVESFNDVLAEKRNYPLILIRLFVEPIDYAGTRVLPLVERVVSRLLRFYREGVDAGAFRKLSSRHFFQSLLGVTLFHYASRDFGAAILETDDLFTSANVSWRRAEVREILLRGVLREDATGETPA
jgi:TetR/AcrR family transcriptional regulator